MYITKSVGVGGKNSKNEVMFVQAALNVLSEEDFRLQSLVEDGKYGPNVGKAIKLYQQHTVKLKTPDGRVDPDGRSEKTLISKLLEIDVGLLPELVKKYGLKKVSQNHSGGVRTVVYRKHAKKVVSVYSKNIVKLAMAYAGINKCDFSSTLRTFDDQARIMYNNCSAYGTATSVNTLRAARGWGYAATGREVEQVYYDTKASGESKTLAAMKSKIELFYKAGKKVSLHCVSEADYRRKNVLDIPYSSVAAAKKK